MGGCSVASDKFRREIISPRERRCPLMSKPTEEIIDYSNFSSIVTGEGDWLPAGFPQSDGSFWQYQEPNAVVIVQDGFLRVAAVPYSRHHDRPQILDNAKHMYFSARQFAPPPGASRPFAIGFR